MDNDIQLISDGDGLAVIGDPAAVARFLTTERLPSKDLGLRRLSTALRTGSTVAKGGSEIAEHSGRWVRLTAESARAMQKYDLMTGSTSDVSRAVLTDHGKINGLLEMVRTGTPSTLLTNPAVLTGAAGLMAQLAMQQTMEEITDYLAVIDAKVDAVLRAQIDAVVADMIGAPLVRGDPVARTGPRRVLVVAVPESRRPAWAVRKPDSEVSGVGRMFCSRERPSFLPLPSAVHPARD